MFNSLIDELEHEQLELERAFAQPITERKFIAWYMQKVGIKPSASTGIHGYITYGYGLLDHNGFWQYPLPDGEYVGDNLIDPPEAV